jgi:glyoxylase-like metal-dependent hydrolase (beta-lactamase superfamily II)
MAEVKILIQGYLMADFKDKKKAGTCPTISLIRDQGKNIVVDPGTVKDQKIIRNKLKAEGLTIDDINIVAITHSHLDHYRNIGMFPRAKALDYWGIWERDKIKKLPARFTNDIEITKTPGHSYDGISLIIKTKEGKIAIVGDLFWKENYPQKDPYASDPKKLKTNRKKILALADWIIPGHGDIYRVKK